MWHYFEVIDGQVLYVILYDFLNKFYINSTVLKYLDYLIIHLRMCLELWRRDRGHIPATLRWLIQDIWKGTCTFWPIGSIFAFFHWLLSRVPIWLSSCLTYSLIIQNIAFNLAEFYLLHMTLNYTIKFPVMSCKNLY